MSARLNAKNDRARGLIGIQRDRPAKKGDALRYIPFGQSEGTRVRNDRRVRGSQGQSGAQRLAPFFPIKIKVELDVGAGTQCFGQVGFER